MTSEGCGEMFEGVFADKSAHVDGRTSNPVEQNQTESEDPHRYEWNLSN